MVSRELNFGRQELDICNDYDNDGYNRYWAIAHQRKIMETARVLNSIGEEFLRDVSGKSGSSIEGYFSGDLGFTGLHGIVGTIDTLLEWLEHSARRTMQDLKKREAVLRGILRLTELGSQASLFGMLEFACKFLDVPDDPYPAQREYITGCLTEINKQKQRIFRIIDQAGDILRDLIETEILDISKGMQFDNVLREAKVEIASCERRLDGAKKVIIELTEKMQAVKWFSRCIRTIGLLLSWYFFYNKYKDSSLSLPVMLLGFLVSAVVWLSLFPKRAYAFHESLSKLSAKHRLLTEGLDDLRERLKSSVDHKDSVLDKPRLEPRTANHDD